MGSQNPASTSASVGASQQFTGLKTIIVEFVATVEAALQIYQTPIIPEMVTQRGIRPRQSHRGNLGKCSEW